MTREQMDRRARLFAATCPFHGLNSDRDLALHVRYVAEEIERLTERGQSENQAKAVTAARVVDALACTTPPRSVSRFLGWHR